jgi:F1F0 ATPase subunit 2
MDWLILALFFLIGMLLGGLYFAALWSTLRKMQASRHPLRLLAVSLLLRMAVLLVAFYLILDDGQWERLAAALPGFLLARAIALRRSRKALRSAASLREESP